MKIAFLGLGSMGTHMAQRLLNAGHTITVWNRTPSKADALAANGAKVAATPAEAAKDNEIVITMLFDDAAHEEVVFGPNGLLAAIEPGAVHMAMSTISVALSERLADAHKHRGIPFVAAPVFGRPNVAEAGKLWIVLAGIEAAVESVKPILEPLSRGYIVVGTEPQQAHAVKLGGNFLIGTMIHSLSEAFVYAESQGVAPAAFIEAVNSALFQSPFYAAYSNLILNPPNQPGVPMTVGVKDISLFRDAAAKGGVHLSLADDMAQIFEQARQDGIIQEDWAVGQYKMAQKRAKDRK